MRSFHQELKFSYFLSITVVLLASFSGTAFAVNLIINPGAETGTTSGWTSNASFLVTSHPHTGVKSFKAYDNSGTYTYVRLSSPISIDRTKCYNVEAYYNMLYNTGALFGGGKPRFYLQQSNSGGTPVRYSIVLVDTSTSGQDVWKYFSRTIGPWGSGCDLDWDSNAALFNFVVEPGGPNATGVGHILWDDVSFYETTAPAPPNYLGNTLGISDTPPPPWPAMSGTVDTITCWNRTYTLGTLGLPSSVQTGGTELLIRPAELRFTKSGSTLVWTPVSRQITSSTDAKVVIDGVATCTVGTMNYTVTAEYDGMIRYDFTLVPESGATVNTMELRFPLRKSLLTLQWMNIGESGAFPLGTGITRRNGSMQYYWLGNEQCGLAMISEDTRSQDIWLPGDPDPNLPGHCSGWRIEQTGDTVEIIWSFVLSTSPYTLPNPWKMTFGIQSTPVRPRPSNWRLLRENAPNANIEIDWPAPGKVRYFSPPVPVDPASYRQTVINFQNQGMRFVPYSSLLWISAYDPEFARNPSWGTGRVNTTSGDVAAMGDTFAEVYPLAAWTDYVVWLNHQLAQTYGTDGIYADMTGVDWYTNPELGFGYYRDGVAHATRPFFAIRTIYQRVYTMLKQLNPNSLLIAHMSGYLNIPHLSFADICLDGEQDWIGGIGALYDNYLDIIPLDTFRAQFMGHQYGFISWFLPQWTWAILADSDVVSRGPDGWPTMVTVEKSQHLFGLGLLHDFSFWPICGTNPDANTQFYGAMDTFGIGDAVFYPYWNNSSLIGGQTSTLIASAYRKPPGGALIVVYNTTRTAQNSNLTVDFNALKPPGTLVVTDAYTGANIPINGNNLSISVPPLNYRLIQVKGLPPIQVQGTVTLQDYDTTKVTGMEVDVEIRNLNISTSLETKTVTLSDAAGSYSFVTYLPAGAYDLSLKKTHWLRQTLLNTTLVAGTNTANFNLFNGDSDEDNEVTTSDLANVLFAMDTMPGDPNWLPEADLDGDEEVTTSDLATVLLNMDLTGNR